MTTPKDLIEDLAIDAESDPAMIGQANTLVERTRALCKDLPFEDEPASFLKALEELAEAEADENA